jgi:hypothetical protein
MYQAASPARKVILLDYGDFVACRRESRGGSDTSGTSTDNDRTRARARVLDMLPHLVDWLMYEQRRNCDERCKEDAL